MLRNVKTDITTSSRKNVVIVNKTKKKTISNKKINTQPTRNIQNTRNTKINNTTKLVSSSKNINNFTSYNKDSSIQNYYIHFFNNIFLNKNRNGPASVGNHSKYHKLLAITDSVHDFKSKGETVIINLQNVISNYIDNKNLQNVSTDRLTDFIHNLTDDKNEITASSVEDKTVSYFEKKLKEELNINLNDSNASIIKLSYQEVINAITENFQNNKKNESILKARNKLFDSKKKKYDDVFILEIDLSNTSNLTWEQTVGENVVYLALFLLNFFYNPKEDGILNTQENTYISFDAGSGYVSKIFGHLTQVINLITPLNIADSAKTLENHLLPELRRGVHNLFAFPEPLTEKNTYPYTSNFYSKDYLELFLKKKDAKYTELNKYDFELHVKKTAGDKLENILIFDNENHKSGPSIDYLSSYMLNSNVETERKMVDLNDLKDIFKDDNIRNKLLFDLKRSGDWEQCNASRIINNTPGERTHKRVILCTIDRLCALYSRSIGQNTIWHNGTKLIFYKFPNDLTDAEIKERQQKNIEDKKKMIQQILENNEHFNILKTFIKNVNILDALKKYNIANKSVIKSGKENFYYFVLFLKNIETILFCKNKLLLFEKQTIAFNAIKNAKLTDTINTQISQIYNDLNEYINDIDSKFPKNENEKNIKITNILNEKKTIEDMYTVFSNMNYILDSTKNTNTRNQNARNQIINNTILFFEDIRSLLIQIKNIYNDNYTLNVDSILVQFAKLAVKDDDFQKNVKELINNNFQEIIKTFSLENFLKKININNANITRVSGGYEFLENNPNNNIIYNLENTITEQFIYLCSSLTEYSENILDKQPKSFEYFIKVIKDKNKNATIVSSDYKKKLEDLYLFINEFLDNVIIEILKMEKILDTKHGGDMFSSKNIFFSILILFSIIKNKVDDSESLITNSPYSSDTNKIFENIYKKLWNEWKNERKVVWRLDPRKQDMISALENAKIPDGIYIDYMLKFCVKSCLNLKKDNNYSKLSVILIIFTFFQSFFKYIIKSRLEKLNIRKDDYSVYGYYPTLINNFDDTEEKVKKFFENLELTISFEPFNIDDYTWEFKENKKMVKKFTEITFHLFVFVGGDDHSNKLFKELRGLMILPPPINTQITKKRKLTGVGGNTTRKIKN